MEEDDILQWLLGHLEDDEIEDVDEDTLERMVKEGKTLAVLFCRFLNVKKCCKHQKIQELFFYAFLFSRDENLQVL